MAAFIKQSSPLGYLTSRYWSPSALGPSISGSGRAVVPVPAVGILRPPAYTLMGVLPFMALGWVFMPADR